MVRWKAIYADFPFISLYFKNTLQNLGSIVNDFFKCPVFKLAKDVLDVEEETNFFEMFCSKRPTFKKSLL